MIINEPKTNRIEPKIDSTIDDLATESEAWSAEAKKEGLIDWTKPAMPAIIRKIPKLYDNILFIYFLYLFIIGAHEQIRTADLLLTMELLYH